MMTKKNNSTFNNVNKDGQKRVTDRNVLPADQQILKRFLQAGRLQEDSYSVFLVVMSEILINVIIADISGRSINAYEVISSYLICIKYLRNEF